MSESGNSFASNNPTHSQQTDPNSRLNPTQQRSSLNSNQQFMEGQENLQSVQQTHFQNFSGQRKPQERDRLKWSEQPTVEESNRYNYTDDLMGDESGDVGPNRHDFGGVASENVAQQNQLVTPINTPNINLQQSHHQMGNQASRHSQGIQVVAASSKKFGNSGSKPGSNQVS